MKLRNKKTGMIEKAYITMDGDKIAVIVADMPLCGNSVLGEYDSLAELNEDWEDYKPKEPLIKDEKVRKAVRAWAEAEGEDCYYGKNATSIYNGAGSRIDFWSRPFTELEEDRHYTIAELCGEEE